MKINRNLITVLLLLGIVLLFSQPALAQGPQDFPFFDGGGDGSPDAKGAPINGLLGLGLAVGAALGGKKLLSKNDKT